MNWFHKMLLVLFLFIAMLSYMAVRSTRTQLDLVTDTYYEEEIKYQDRINDISNNDQLADKVKIDVIDSRLNILFPSTLNSKEVKGKINLYFAANKKNDLQFELNLDDQHQQNIELDKMSGKYSVQIQWSYQNKTYYTEKKLFL